MSCKAASSLQGKVLAPTLPLSLPQNQAQWTQFIVGLQSAFRQLAAAGMRPSQNLIPSNYSTFNGSALPAFAAVGCTVSQDASTTLGGMDTLKVAVTAANASLTFGSGLPFQFTPNANWVFSCFAKSSSVAFGVITVSTAKGAYTTHFDTSLNWEQLYDTLNLVADPNAIFGVTLTFPSAVGTTFNFSGFAMQQVPNGTNANPPAGTIAGILGVDLGNALLSGVLPYPNNSDQVTGVIGNNEGNGQLNVNPAGGVTNNLPLGNHAASVQLGSVMGTQVNLIPDSGLKSPVIYWPTKSGTLSITKNIDNVNNCIEYRGTGSASAYNYLATIPFTVTPGTYTLSANGWVNNVTSGHPSVDVYDTALQNRYGQLTLTGNGRQSTQITIPSGVTQVVVAFDTDNCIVASGQGCGVQQIQLEQGSVMTAYKENVGDQNAGTLGIDLNNAIHLNRNLDYVPDGVSGTRNAVFAIDANRRALIDLAQTGHLNRNLDYVPDGVSGTRNAVFAIDANRRALIDLAQTGHLNRTANNITYLGGGTVDEYRPSQPGADVTADNTAADTNNVNGLAATRISNGSNLLYLNGTVIDTLMPAQAGADVTAGKPLGSLVGLISDNMVPNGDFSQGLLGWNFSAGWMWNPNIVAPVGHIGVINNAVPNQDLTLPSCRLPVDPNKTYLLECWIWVNNATATNYIGFAEYNSSGTAISHQAAGTAYGYPLARNSTFTAGQFIYLSAEVSGNGGTSPTDNQFNSGAATFSPLLLLNYNNVADFQFKIYGFLISEVAAGARRGLQSTTPGSGNYKAYMDGADDTAGGHINMPSYSLASTVTGAIQASQTPVQDGGVVTFATPFTSSPQILWLDGGCGFASNQYQQFTETLNGSAGNWTGFTASLKIVTPAGAITNESINFSSNSATLSVPAGETVVNNTLTVSGTLTNPLSEPDVFHVTVTDASTSTVIGSALVGTNAHQTKGWSVSCTDTAAVNGTVLTVSVDTGGSVTASTVAYEVQSAPTPTSATPPGFPGVNWIAFATS